MPIICPICNKPMIDGICFNCGYDIYNDTFNADILDDEEERTNALDDILDDDLDGVERHDSFDDDIIDFAIFASNDF